VVLCGHRQSLTPEFAERLASAAIISATLIVQSGTSSPPRCLILRGGEVVNLHIRDRVQFVANSSPQIQIDQSQTEAPWAANPGTVSVVSVRTSTGPLQGGPGQPGGVLTSHLIVTATATHPGRATLTWTDCSGTGC
jgi:hypothetical protein